MIGNKFEVIDYKGETIFDCSLKIVDQRTLETALKVIHAYISNQELGSVLTCVELSELPMEDKTIVTMKKYLQHTDKYAKKIAIVPHDTLTRAFMIEVNKGRHNKFGIFKDKKEALEWLIKKQPGDVDEFEEII